MLSQFKTYIGFAVACLLIITAILLSNYSISKFIDNSEWMTHTFEVRSEAEKLSTILVWAQNNIRAYHMSEERYYLDLHNQARSDLQARVTKLQGLTADNQAQQENLKA